MARLVFTDAAIRKLKLPTTEERQLIYWDSLLKTFGIRLGFQGTRTWIVQPRTLKNGQWRSSRITLGRFPDVSLAEARDKAREVLIRAEKGEEVSNLRKEERRDLEAASRNTFGLLADSFLNKHVEGKNLRPSTAKEYRRALKGPDVAAWENRPITAITVSDVHDVLDSIVARGAKIWANRILAYQVKFFEWCISRDKLESNPLAKIERPSPNVQRSRALTASEIKEVWSAAGKLKAPFGHIVKLLLLTGQRRTEVTELNWDELSGLETKEPLWVLPSARSKNKRLHEIPLSPAAAALIAELAPAKHDPASQYVFTVPGEKKPPSGFSKIKCKLDSFIADSRREAGVAEDMAAWTFHDLRRTAATLMHSPLKVQPHIVEAILNHISGHKGGLGGVYNVSDYKHEKRQALNAWAAWLTKITAEKYTNVHLLRGHLAAE